MSTTKERTFNVYMHIAPNDKRYIGVTYRKPRIRWGKDGCGYKDNLYFWRAIQKYGWDNIQHIIVATDLSYEDACKLEVELIKLYKTTDEHFGYNHSSGGDVHSLGCVRTDEQRKKYSESKMGSKNPMYHKPSWNKGIPCADSTKQKLSKANKGRKLGKRKPLSEEMKQHLHEINIGKIYVTNDDLDITKCIDPEELDGYILIGYRRGYKKNRKHRWSN